MKASATVYYTDFNLLDKSCFISVFNFLLVCLFVCLSSWLPVIVSSAMPIHHAMSATVNLSFTTERWSLHVDIVSINLCATMDWQSDLLANTSQRWIQILDMLKIKQNVEKR